LFDLKKKIQIIPQLSYPAFFVFLQQQQKLHVELSAYDL